MKKAILVFLLLTISACEKESQEKGVLLETSRITGSWQLIAQSYSIGGPLIIETIENGGIYEFVLEGTFTFKYAQDNSLDFSGRYSFENEILTLDYTLATEIVQRTLNVQFENDRAELIPTNPRCIEGCSFTLKRLL